MSLWALDWRCLPSLRLVPKLMQQTSQLKFSTFRSSDLPNSSLADWSMGTVKYKEECFCSPDLPLPTFWFPMAQLDYWAASLISISKAILMSWSCSATYLAFSARICARLAFIFLSSYWLLALYKANLWVSFATASSHPWRLQLPSLSSLLLQSHEDEVMHSFRISCNSWSESVCCSMPWKSWGCGLYSWVWELEVLWDEPFGFCWSLSMLEADWFWKQEEQFRLELLVLMWLPDNDWLN